jgi:hypothetical protein
MSGISSRSIETPTLLKSAPASSGPLSGTLRCQWCSVPLAAGITRCPSCGSAGVPDPRLSPTSDNPPLPAPLAAAPTVDAYAPLTVEQVDALAPPPLDQQPSVDRKQLTWEEAERRQFRTIAIAAAAILVCTFLGWLSGPLLSGVVENFTGTPVENPSDLRTMGALIGLLSGFAVGGVAGTVIWANR